MTILELFTLLEYHSQHSLTAEILEYTYKKSNI